MKSSGGPFQLPTAHCLLPTVFASWPASLLIALLLIAVTALGVHLYYRHRLRGLARRLRQGVSMLEAAPTERAADVLAAPSPELAEALQTVLQALRRSQQAQHQFSQHAAHELQTPLAVIKNHVELLLQSPRLAEGEMNTLGTILQHLNRLSRLISALILLSKIDHPPSEEREIVDLQQIVEVSLHHFRDLLNIKGVQVRKQYLAQPKLTMSASLLEILVANLLQNAIRHNHPEQPYIDIQLDAHRLIITNPGPELHRPAQELFERFAKESTAEESLGLGLSIVRRIAEVGRLQVSYEHDDGLHKLVVEW